VAHPGSSSTWAGFSKGSSLADWPERSVVICPRVAWPSMYLQAVLPPHLPCPATHPHKCMRGRAIEGLPYALFRLLPQWSAAHGAALLLLRSCTVPLYFPRKGARGQGEPFKGQSVRGGPPLDLPLCSYPGTASAGLESLAVVLGGGGKVMGRIPMQGGS
jgi:hypothetical protein